MNKLTLDPMPGDTFSEVAKEAKTEAIKFPELDYVEFEFNGILCKVNKDSNLDWLFRDYNNSWDADWKEIGPDFVETYPKEVQEMIDENRKKKEIESEKQRKEWEKKDKAQKQVVEKSVKGMKISIIPGKEKEYEEYVTTNSNDGYSRGVIDYAEYWAKLMQIEILKGRKVHEVAEECQQNLGFLGITGFMYGCAVQALAHFWEHGEELRKWHNKQYGVDEDKKGVANPAVFTITNPS